MIVARHFDFSYLRPTISSSLAAIYWLVFIRIFDVVEKLLRSAGGNESKSPDLRRLGRLLCFAAAIDLAFLLGNVLLDRQHSHVVFHESDPLGGFFNFIESAKPLISSTIRFISPGTFGVSSLVLALIAFKLAVLREPPGAT
jgi:hypothetical protein